MRARLPFLFILFASTALRAQPSSHTDVCGPAGSASGSLARQRAGDDSTLFTGWPGSIVGNAALIGGGFPLEFIRVSVYRNIRDTTAIRRVRADPSGFFKFDSLPTSYRYVLLFEGAMAERQWYEVRLLSAAAETLCVHLRFDPVGLAPVGVGGLVGELEFIAPSARVPRRRN
jgi:hypothetical protein